MAHQIMAVLLSREGETGAAAVHLETAVKLSPDEPELRFNLAKAYRDLGRNLDAAQHLQTVSQAWPDRADVWLEMGIVLRRAEDFAAAAKATAKAVSLGAQDAQVLSNLASMYVQTGDTARAEAAAMEALKLDPSFSAAWVNLGVVHESRDDIAKAIQVYEKVLAAAPEDATAASRRALALLASGHLGAGWQAYAERHTWPGIITCAGQNSAPLWNGSDLTGRSILIWTEQGLGDEILCGTMIADAVRQAEDVTIACSERLVPAFTRAFPDAQVVPRGDNSLGQVKAQTFDVQASLTELGAALRSNVDSFATLQPYLQVDPDRVNALRAKYPSGDGKRPLIGIAWQSGNAQARLQKSSDLTAWADVLGQEGAAFVSLQYGNIAPQLERLQQESGLTLQTDSDIDPVADFDAFIHQVAAMDLVIATSNTTVHAAGALGVPVWTLVPCGLGRPWYWFIDRADSLWYPTMKLYRQQRAGDWTAPLAAAASDLKSWIARWTAPSSDRPL